MAFLSEEQAAAIREHMCSDFKILAAKYKLRRKMESANSKPDNKTAVSEEPKAKEQNDIAKENVAKSNNSNSIEATQEEGPSLKEVIKQNATEEESPLSKNFTLNKILGGDILTSSTIRRQIWVFLLIAFFTLIYISNRYSCQQDLIEIDKLQERLQDAKFKALSSSSQMTERSRESNVLELLKNNSDSTLKTPNQPPYIITVPEDN